MCHEAMDPPHVSAEVVKVEMATERGEAHANFIIRVSCDEHSYTVRRRYRQFDTLHASLRAGYRGLPELPSKGRVLSATKDVAAVAEERREPLTVYLRTLLADPFLSVSSELTMWLELNSAKPLFATLHEMEAALRERNEPKQARDHERAPGWCRSRNVHVSQALPGDTSRRSMCGLGR